MEHAYWSERIRGLYADRPRYARRQKLEHRAIDFFEKAYGGALERELSMRRACR